jgi:two-component system CheB/CheR fusion protein
MAIQVARGRVRLEPDRVLVVPADCDAVFQRDELVVTEGGRPRAPLDRLLRSLADEHGNRGTCVLLDGQGHDGMLGIKRLKEAGGLTLAQAPEGQNHVAWSAVTTGLVDVVVPRSAVADRLAAFVRPDADPDEAGAADVGTAGDEVARRDPEASADTLQDMLLLLRIRSGHDFSAYKRGTLYRRVSRRLDVCQCRSIADYHQYLREHPDEVTNLLRDFLISVTNFFRDRDAFEALAGQVIPRLFEGKSRDEPVRVWVAGCATGEEAYSVAMLLREHAATLPFPPPIQVFATDIDDAALTEARAGRYPNTIASDVSPARLHRFFTIDGDQLQVSKELREIVLFSPQNVLRDPPFSRLDLVTCRNLLIYLNREAQGRVLGMFHFGLRPDGFLFLGSSESAENTSMFAPCDAKHRLFVRRGNTSRTIADSLVPHARWEPSKPASIVPAPIERSTVGQLHHQLVERYAPPSVLVDDELNIVHVSEHAGRLLQLAGGEPSRQLLQLVHPALRVELRTAIHAARQRGRGGGDTRVVRFRDDDRPRAIELRVRAASQPELAPGALLIMFDEVDPSPNSETGSAPPAAELEPMVRGLEDELHNTRDQLRTTIEQYEISVEELKASNEELQAINEELRSATEELETSKEELQSVNEELTTLNHELKLKVDEVSHAHSDLQNLMTSTDIGVVFLDRQLHIKRFTPRAQDLFNVIPGDIGRPLAHLTHRLDTDELPALAQSVLQTLRTVEREVKSRDHRRYLARLLPYRSVEDRIGGVVMTFVEVSDLRNAVDARQRSEAALHASEERLRFALRTAPMVVVTLDDRLRVTWGYVLGEELVADATGEVQLPGLFAPEQAERFTAVAGRVLGDGIAQRVELDVTVRGEPRTFELQLERTELGISAVGFDITPSKLVQGALLEADRRKDEFLATLSHELRNPLTPLKVALDVVKLAGDDRDQVERTWGIMERQVAQLTQLVDDLLDLSRIAQGKIELERALIDPTQIVEAAVESTRPLFQQRRHQLTVDLPRVASSIAGDRSRLTQVLTNVLNNAAKYTPPGGHIALAVDVDHARDVLQIRVRDDGDGIAPDLLPRIFEIFVQSRARRHAQGGLGIGLNLVQRLVKLHGGTVAASSPGPGQGSEFTIELPISADQAAP